MGRKLRVVDFIYFLLAKGARPYLTISNKVAKPLLISKGVKNKNKRELDIVLSWTVHSMMILERRMIK